MTSSISIRAHGRQPRQLLHSGHGSRFCRIAASGLALLGLLISSPALTADSPKAVLSLSDYTDVQVTGARNPTLAVDSRDGSVHLAWARIAQESASSSAPSAVTRKAPMQAVLARSTDGGRSFSQPVLVSQPDENVHSTNVTPTQVAIGPAGQIYVLYSRVDPDVGYVRGRRGLRLARSMDGGKHFDYTEVCPATQEGLVCSSYMINLFVAGNGDLYATWLDYRESQTFLAENDGKSFREVQMNAARSGKRLAADMEPQTQLRIARSTDGGKSFGKSSLVMRGVCQCCGTKAAQIMSGALFAGTRSSWRELKGSIDTVRDKVLSMSQDSGMSWSAPAKIHDDRFRVSGCPDVTFGLAGDSKGRLHAAWYTGSGRGPGVYYAVSDFQGKAFSKPLALLTDDWVPYANVKLALDAKDNAWVAFEDRRSDIDQIHLARIATDSKVARSQSWPGIHPDLTAAGGSVVVAWEEPSSEGKEHGSKVSTRVARTTAKSK